MRRTVRNPRHVAGSYVTLCFVLMVAIYLLLTEKGGVGDTVLLFVSAVVVLIGWSSLEAFWNRVVIDADQIEIRAVRKRDRLRVPLSDVVAYQMDPSGCWWVVTEDRKIKVPIQEPWELHRAFIDWAPKKMGARKVRFEGLRSQKEFRGLWVHDLEDTTSKVVGSLAAMVVIFFFIRKTPWIIVSQFGLPLGTAIARAGTRIDVTEGGIQLRGFRLSKSIPWSEVKAIVCEKRRKRSFVLIGPNGAIEIPSHLANDLPLMQRVIFSLPNPVLCVNFDETTMRGYKKRKAKAKEEKIDLLQPILTTFSKQG